MTKTVTAAFLALALSSNLLAAPADPAQSTEERLARLERLVNSQGLVDIMVRLESVQTEMQRMRGEMEVQKHAMEELKKRQRDLYLDIDRRLLQLERRSGGGSAATTGPVPVSPMSTATPTTTPVTTPETETMEDGQSVAVSGAHSEEEQVAYQKAFDLLRALRYDQATKAFRQFLVDYPDGRYAHIAQYWLAEASYHTRQYQTAIQDYQTLIDKYPKSPKRAQALLKIGYSHYELKDYDRAKASLEQLLQSYPGTTEAGQAENLLQKIRLQKAP